MSGFEIIVDGLWRAIEIILSGNPEIMGITLLSLKVSITATLLGAVAGIPLGYIIATKDFIGRSFVAAIINTFMGLPPVAVGLVVYLMLSSFGPLGFLGLLYTPEAMIIAQLILAFPIVCGITISSVMGLNPKLKETLSSLNAPAFWQARVLLNESRLGILTALIAAFGAAISEVGAIMMVGGNLLGYTRALTTAIMLYTSMGDFAIAIALGIILMLIAFVINIFLTVLQTRSRSKSSI